MSPMHLNGEIVKMSFDRHSLQEMGKWTEDLSGKVNLGHICRKLLKISLKGKTSGNGQIDRIFNLWF